MHQPGLCCLHRLCINPKRQILGLRKSVVVDFHLMPQHTGVLISHLIEAIRLMRNSNAFFELLCIRRQIHKAKLKMH